MAIKLDIGEEDIHIALKDVIYDNYIQEKLEKRLKQYLDAVKWEKDDLVGKYEWDNNNRAIDRAIYKRLEALEKDRAIYKRLEALEKKCKIKSD